MGAWRAAEIMRITQEVGDLGLVYYVISIEQQDGMWQAVGNCRAHSYAWPVGYMAFMYPTLSEAKRDIEHRWVATLTAMIERSASEAHELNDMLKLGREREHVAFFGQMSLFAE